MALAAAPLAAPLHALGLTLAAVAAPLDTIVTKAAPSDPGWFERTAEVLQALMALAILALAVAVVPAAWRFRKGYRKVRALLDQVYADVVPITHRTRQILENVDHVSATVRADVDRASALVARAEERLEATLARAEARARDLEALLDVAQAQAEDSLVSAAATVAGVRGGFASLRESLRESLAEPLDADPLDADLPDDAALVDVDQDSLRDAPVSARPRIRARRA